MRRFRLPLTLALVTLLVAFGSTLAYSTDFDDLEIGEMAPDFILKDLAEKEYTLSDLEGEIVVVQFGSSTTIPYLEQIKPMNGLIKKYKRKGVTFLTVYTVEQRFNWQANTYFAKYERAKGLRFQYGVQAGQRMGAKILVDDMDEAVFVAYGSVPAGVFIVDQDGNLVFKAKTVKPDDIEKALKKLM